jgi:hypothetical protein
MPWLCSLLLFESGCLQTTECVVQLLLLDLLLVVAVQSVGFLGLLDS